MANLKDTTSNIAAFSDAVDVKIGEFAGNFAKGEVSRLSFLEHVASAHVAKTLRHSPPKGKGKVTHLNYAHHAIEVWNTKRAAKLSAKLSEAKGEPVTVAVRAVDGSRKTELGYILKAVAARPDIVTAAWKAYDVWAAEQGDDYKGKTYENIVKVAKAQASDIEHRLSDKDIVACFEPTESEPDEGKSVAAMVKKLDKLAEQFPANASVYDAAKAALAPVAHMLTGPRAKFIADAVKNGYAPDTAAAFYDSKMAA